MRLPIPLLAPWMLLLSCGTPERAPHSFPGDGPPRAAEPAAEDGAQAADAAAERRPGRREAPRPRGEGAPPRILGEIADGTIRDVVGTPSGPWITSGRNLWRLDPLSGEPLELHPASPFAHTLGALEVATDGTLWASTGKGIYRLDADGAQRLFESPELGRFFDFELLGDSGAVAALAGREVVVLGPGEGGRLVLRARSGQIADLLSLDRLEVLEHAAGYSVYVVGAPRTARQRWVRALVRLEIPRDTWVPRIQGAMFDPTEEFDDPSATTQAVAVLAYGNRRVAYVAAGKAGQLLRLDVSDPARPRRLGRIVLAEEQRVLNVSVDRERDLVFAVSANRLHVLEGRGGELLSELHVPFQDAGERGLGLCVLPDGRRILWSGNRHEVEYALYGIDVSDPRAPRVIARRWWLASSDGAVAIPEWDSVYLPTWGGIARYDISDPTRPVPRGYQPAGVGATEHIEWIWRDPDSREEAYLVTPQGNGPILLWPVSRQNPDPGPPRRFDYPLPGLEPGRSYQNDAEFYRKDGELYLLSDMGCRVRGEVTLRAIEVSSGRRAHASERHAELLANAQSITVAGDLAFVTCIGGFFVVRLDLLPERLEVVGEHVLRHGTGRFRASGLAVSADRRHVFVGRDSPGVVLSLAYDPQRHRASAPLSVIDGLEGIAGRMRLVAGGERLFAAAREGLVYEFDVADPRRLRLRSTWQAPGYDGPMQDVHPIETREGLLILAAKNNEGFALLVPAQDP